MKRLLLCLMLLLPAPAWAATCTFSADGLWSAGGSCATNPTSADTCVINSTIVVKMNESAGVCGSLTLNGHLYYLPGARTLTIGEGTAGAPTDAVTIGAAASLIIGPGQSLLINTTNTTHNATEGLISVAGYLSLQGSLEYEGVVQSQGAFSGVTGDPRTFTITDVNLNQADNVFAGMVLVPLDGWFHDQWFDITANSGTTITVNADSRGAFDTRNIDAGTSLNRTAWAPGDHGEIYSSGTAAVSGATVTLSAALSSGTALSAAAHGAQLIGAKWICNADLNTADDADWATIIAAPTTSTFTLSASYGGAGCATTAAYRLYSYNRPVGGQDFIELFTTGDRYIVINPAAVSVPAGSQSNTDHDQNLQIEVDDGATFTAQYASISYCGMMNSGSGQGPACIQTGQIDNDNADEGFYLDTVEIGPYNGEAALVLDDMSNVTFNRVAVRDCLDGGNALNSGSECHGIRLDDPIGGGRNTNVKFVNGRVVRTNDWPHSWFEAGEADSVNCSNCSIRGAFIGWVPANIGGSTGAVQPAEPVTNFIFENNMVVNINGRFLSVSGAATNGQAVTGYARNNIMINTVGQAGDVGTTTDSNGIRAADLEFYFVGNYIAHSGGTTGPVGFSRGHFFNNLIDAKTDGVGAEMLRMPATVKGNIFLWPDNAPATSGLALEPTGSNQLLPSTVSAWDNAFRGPLVPLAVSYFFGGKIGTSTLSPTFDDMHNSFFGTVDIAGTQRAYQERGTGATHTIKCTVFANLTGPTNDLGEATVTADRTITWRNGVWDGDVDLTNDLVDGILGYADPLSGNFNLRAGSDAAANVCDTTGHPRGVRIAGPDYRALWRVYPHLLPTPFINNIGGVDWDGDGIYDLHDNCDYTPNPMQTDGDADGKGCACDYGDTCP